MTVPEHAVHYLEIVTPDVEAARLGAEILLESMEIPGHGRIAIYRHGGVQQGLWETP